jgi:cytochrome c-type biogenesis protein CcmH/NrfG
MPMKIDRGLVLTLGVAAVASACAAAGGTGGGMRVTIPPPDVACPGGPLTSFAAADSVAYRLTLVNAQPEDARPAAYLAALEQARRAVAAQPENAYGYYLAGQAALEVGDFAEAEQMFDQAVRFCPALAEAEVEGLRARAASLAFERAGSLLSAADTAGAVAAYEASLRLYPNNYPADFYLGLIAFQRQNTAQAVTYWRRVIEGIDRSPATDDAEVVAERAAARANAMNALIFAARQYLEREETAAAADLLTEIRRGSPNNAEAAYYHALALNTQQRWSELLPVARQATELAPLSYGAWILYYNAFAGQSQAATEAGNNAQSAELARQAREVSERSERLPVQIEAVTLDVTDERTELRGVAVGTGQTAAVTVEFTLHGLEGPVGTGRVTITPPAREQQQPFELAIENTAPVLGVSYRIVGG